MRGSHSGYRSRGPPPDFRPAYPPPLDFQGPPNAYDPYYANQHIQDPHFDPRYPQQLPPPPPVGVAMPGQWHSIGGSYDPSHPSAPRGAPDRDRYQRQPNDPGRLVMLHRRSTCNANYHLLYFPHIHLHTLPSPLAILHFIHYLDCTHVGRERGSYQRRGDNSLPPIRIPLAAPNTAPMRAPPSAEWQDRNDFGRNKNPRKQQKNQDMKASTSDRKNRDRPDDPPASSNKRQRLEDDR